MKMKTIQIKIAGIDAKIVWIGSSDPKPEELQEMKDISAHAHDVFKMTSTELKQRFCNHDWVETNSGYCADCKKCGKKM